MEKSDLRSGMLIERRDGKIGLVLMDTGQKRGCADVIASNGGCDDTLWCPLSNFRNDLTNRFSERFDIIAVYSITSNMHAASFSKERRELLWQRIDVKEYTHAELVEKLGENFIYKG